MIKRDTIISLADLTGNFVQPWVDAGYQAILVDPQHGTDSYDGQVYRIAGTVLDAAERLGPHLTRAVLVAGWPPCTDVAVSGSRWFEKKRMADPHFQAKAALVAEQCRMVGKLAGCPWFFENPVSVFSSIFGKPSHVFHPWQYTGYCPEDNYTKTTCLWSGGDFTMPKPNLLDGIGPPDDRIHKCPPGPDRANIRSATPKGFSQAVFEANRSKALLMEAA